MMHIPPAVATFLLFVVVRHHVALSLDVVDPATNYGGWCAWSLIVTMLSWHWWVALQLQGRGERTWKAAFMTMLVVIDTAMYPERGWTYVVYGAALTSSQHGMLYALDLIFDVVKNVMLSFIAIMAAGRPSILIAVVPVVALKVFADEIVSHDLAPFLMETTTFLTVIALYAIVVVTMTLHLRGGSVRPSKFS